MTSWVVACEEWRLLLRNRVALIVMGLFLLLALLVTLVSHERQAGIDRDRARYQQAADVQFQGQPDRHPHRVVHYGHFLFRPAGALAAFDPGIERFTGHMIYLEGHRQNTANFGEARQSSLLLRFGELTPAFVLQTLAPLLLIFLGFGCVARERERGTLQVLLAQGASAGQIVIGKWLALGGAALLMAVPALIGIAALAFSASAATRTDVALLAVAYAMYLLIWAGIIVALSAWVRSSRNALLGGIAVWALLIIALPRALPEIAAVSVPMPTRFEDDISIHRELAAMGDSHDPNDPHFAEFRRSVLDRYGAERIEDLPVNYAGLLGVEGERMSSQLFDEYTTRAYTLQEKQSGLVRRLGIVSPLVSLRTLSMAVAQTDLAGYRGFLDQAERHRYRLVQALNQMQADKITYAADADELKENRIDAAHFRGLQRFSYETPSRASVRARALPALGGIGAWVIAVALAVTASTWRSHRRLAG